MTALCSHWSTYDNSSGRCVCHETITKWLHCNASGYINAIQDCACITYDQDTNTTEVGQCIYGCNKEHGSITSPHLGYFTLPTEPSQWNKVMCGYHKRRGSLCGACEKGYFAPAYSYDMQCVKCGDWRANVWKYLLWAFGPLTLFYFLLLAFPINVVSSKLMGFVFCCQIVSFPQAVRSLLMNESSTHYTLYEARLMEAIYGIWNLDFGRTYSSGVCLQTGTLFTLSLDLVVASYPLLLMVLTYIMIIIHDKNYQLVLTLEKPLLTLIKIYHSNWNIKSSTIDCFVTFTLLSYVKLLSVCWDLLTPVTVYRFVTVKEISTSRRLYYDTTLDYFGPEHLPYAVIAIFILSLLTFLPILVLCLYPFKYVQNCLNKHPGRFRLVLNTFVDSFQGCYKNGTDKGTRDCRFFSALQFITRTAIITAYCFTLSITFGNLVSVFLAVVVLTILIVDPFKKDFQGISDIWLVYILSLSCFIVSVLGFNLAESRFPVLIRPTKVVSNVVIFLPILYKSFLAVQIFFSHEKIQKLFKRMKL